MNLKEIRTVEVFKREFPTRYRKLFGCVPKCIEFSAANWVLFGVNIGGDFFQRVIRNDLVGAFNHADAHNTVIMDAYARWLFNDAPLGSWREENLETWAGHNGLVGLFIEQGFEEITDEGFDSPGGGS